ncbi:MAG: carboxypeptidase-like regulatory domain-containing protein, partial [Candidatus Hydrogenedentes bacterium]|nr:carboxypeptidase-like regulatory domain-containing protein [Candidatus Hydrogenedentota bacterium]
MRTFASRRKNSVFLIATLAASCLCSHAQPSCSGTVRDAQSNAAIPYAYVAITDASFAVIAQGSTDASGAISLTSEKPLAPGYVIVQPPANENKDGIGIYSNAPRIYAYKGEPTLDIKLPPAACIVIMAYDAQGKLMRWEDFRARGTFGDQFMYLTDLNDCAIEATCWPVFDADARAQGQPREKGLPALIVAPGAGYVPQVLFWQTKDYGTLLLRADNKTLGFALAKPGNALVINLNYELARTAVYDLERRKFTERTLPVQMALQAASDKLKPNERAAAADIALALALRLRDDLELKRARETISANNRAREGFSFGVFEGSPYNAKAFL